MAEKLANVEEKQANLADTDQEWQKPEKKAEKLAK